MLYAVDEDADFACLLLPSPERSFGATEWLTNAIREHWHASEQRPTGTRLSWAIGSSVGGEALLQSRPSVRSLDDGFVEDLLRARAACTLATCRTVRDTPAHQNIHPLRFGRWIGFGDVRFNESSRPESDQLLNIVPSFLTRHIPSPNNEQIPFLLFLADLYQKNVNQSGRMTIEEGNAALHTMHRQIEPLLSRERSSYFAVTDGRYLLGFTVRRPLVRLLGPAETSNTARTLTATGATHPIGLVLSTKAGAGDPSAMLEGCFAIDARDPTRLIRARS